MAKKTGSLLDQVGPELKKAVSKHKNDETKADTGGSLPDGIEGGIAKLVECKFDKVKPGKENAGKYYFYAAGIVCRPKLHNGVPIEGLRTSIMEPVYKTPGRSRETVEDHIEWILNEMRKLGVDTSDVAADNLEETAAALKEAEPYFRFRTWKGQKQTTGKYKDKEPRTNEVWQGQVDFEEGDEDEVDEDEDEETEESEEEEEEAEESEEPDLDALAAAADDEEDEDAQAELTGMAKKFKLNPKKFATWADLAAAIFEHQQEEEEEEADEEEEEEEEEEVAPEKGQECGYKPPKSKKVVKCKITSVSAKDETCTLKAADGTIYKAVSWAELQEV